jgi:hypothetical protein
MPSAHYQGSRELRDIQKISLFEKDYVVYEIETISLGSLETIID